MKRTPLSRRTPLAPGPGPKRRTPIRKRNAKRRDPAKAVAQREAVIERSGGRCEFERRVAVGEDVGPWERCPNPGTDTAHLIRRWLAGAAIYDADVAVFACRGCHAVFDSRLFPGAVRPPEVAVARAVAAVKRAEAARAEAGKAVVRLTER